MAKHKVTLNSHCNYGYVEYDDETKKITVSIPGDLEAQKRVEEYLSQTQTMDVPSEHDHCYVDYYGYVTILISMFKFLGIDAILYGIDAFS